MTTIITLLGSVLLLLAVGWLCSENRRAVKPRVIFGALGLQLAIVAFILFVPFGNKVLLALSGGVNNILAYANEGIAFIFGDLGSSEFGFIFAIKVLPVIVFMSSLMSLLYYFGIMQWIVVTKIARHQQNRIYGRHSEYLCRQY